MPPPIVKAEPQDLLEVHKHELSVALTRFSTFECRLPSDASLVKNELPNLQACYQTDLYLNITDSIRLCREKWHQYLANQNKLIPVNDDAEPLAILILRLCAKGDFLTWVEDLEGRKRNVGWDHGVGIEEFLQTMDADEGGTYMLMAKMPDST